MITFETNDDQKHTTATLPEKKKQNQNQGDTPQNWQTDVQEQEQEQVENKSLLNKILTFRIDLGPGRKDILNFTIQLAVMVRAGISIQDSMNSIAEEIQNPKFKKILLDIKSKIEEGQSLSQALANHPKVFSALYINMVAAAELSGSLSEMLQRLAEYLDAEADTRAQVKGAMIYPIIIATLAVTVVIFLLTFVLPKFTKIFAGKEHLLPMPTKMLMAISAFLQSYWYFVVIVIVAAVAGFIYFISTEIGRRWWDRTKLIIPLIRTLCKSLYISRSLHTMSVLTAAGVPILDTISITAHISGNVLYKSMWLGVYEEVKQGKKIAGSLSKYHLMPPNVKQMIKSGEDSGTLSEVLKDISEFYARQLKTVIKATVSMIEPIMIVLMGVFVGFIAMSIMLPIFQMSNLVSGK